MTKAMVRKLVMGIGLPFALQAVAILTSLVLAGGGDFDWG